MNKNSFKKKSDLHTFLTRKPTQVYTSVLYFQLLSYLKKKFNVDKASLLFLCPVCPALALSLYPHKVIRTCFLDVEWIWYFCPSGSHCSKVLFFPIFPQGAGKDIWLDSKYFLLLERQTLHLQRHPSIWRLSQNGTCISSFTLIDFVIFNSPPVKSFHTF